MVEVVERRRATAHRRAVAQRNYRRQRDRALARLRRLYPDDYLRLLTEERERDEAEGKVWLDLSGRPDNLMALKSENRNTRSTQADLHNQPEGNYGGEA